jgi:hypothetical protein
MSQTEPTPTEAFLPKASDREIGATGGEGDALLDAVESALVTLSKLTGHGGLFDATAAKSVEQTIHGVRKRLDRNDLNVVVVGERQSGKTTLLDAIVGDRLLGGARGQIGVPTFIRRRDSAGYVATFRSGATEDFAELLPDSTAEFVKTEERLEQSLADAKQRCVRGRSELRRAIEAREGAEQAAEDARGKLEEASRVAGTATSDLALIERDAGRVEAVVAEIEPAIPEILRRTPPRWAIWIWAFRVLFILFKRGVWKRYQAILAERESARARLLTGRNAAQDSSQARASAEVRVEPLVSGVTSAHAQAGDVERTLRAAEKERDELVGKLADLRSEREHYESERRRRFFSDLKALSGERGRERGLAELVIDYPARLLPSDVTIIDMPGDSDDGAKQWEAIRERADGCIFVSELDRGVTESAKQFLRRVRESMPHLLLVLTKVDNAFAAAVTRGGGDPWAQVDQARRIGTRRFARELGRDPDTVLSVAVAAEVALMPRDSELGRRFESEAAKLFQLIRHERAIILGAHAGSAIRRCIGSTAEAEARAEAAYRTKIDELERKRTPLPETFTQARLAAAGPDIELAARDALSRAVAALQSNFSVPRRFAEQAVEGCAERRGLPMAIERVSDELSERVKVARREAYLELEAGIERGVEAIAGRLFEELRQQYRLLHKLERSASSSSQLGPPADDSVGFTPLVPEIEKAVAAFDKGRYALGASGVVMGGAAGLMSFHWIGAAVGAAFGGLSAFARREGALRKRALGVVSEALSRIEAKYVDEMNSLDVSVQSAIRQATERDVARAILRFGRWINEPIEAEQSAIDAERRKLADLESVRAELAEHDHELERLLKAAADASVGLCR